MAVECEGRAGRLEHDVARLRGDLQPHPVEPGRRHLAAQRPVADQAVELHRRPVEAPFEILRRSFEVGRPDRLVRLLDVPVAGPVDRRLRRNVTVAERPEPRHADRIARELDRLLAHANVPPPYLLVGHSFGGLAIRLFAARKERRAVSGLVLVDATHEHQFQRMESAGCDSRWRRPGRRFVIANHGQVPSALPETLKPLAQRFGPGAQGGTNGLRGAGIVAAPELDLHLRIERGALERFNHFVEPLAFRLDAASVPVSMRRDVNAVRTVTPASDAEARHAFRAIREPRSVPCRHVCRRRRRT